MYGAVCQPDYSRLLLRECRCKEKAGSQCKKDYIDGRAEQETEGEKYEKELTGLPARAVCHELDHLEGILFYTKKYEGKE